MSSCFLSFYKEAEASLMKFKVNPIGIGLMVLGFVQMVLQEIQNEQMKGEMKQEIKEEIKREMYQKRV